MSGEDDRADPTTGSGVKVSPPTPHAPVTPIFSGQTARPLFSGAPSAEILYRAARAAAA